MPTAAATAATGTARNAPTIPIRTAPEVSTPRMTTGCSDTARRMIVGWRTLDSICCTTTTMASTISAVVKPPPSAASATSTANSPVTNAPITGTNPPRNTSTARGSTSGTPTIHRPMPMPIASMRATSAVPRTNPARAVQPRLPAARIVSRCWGGVRPMNQSTICAPSFTKKNSSTTARMTATIPSTIATAIDPTWVAIVPMVPST